MSSENTAKVAVVTGGNKGIGLEIVRGLRQRGWTVVLGSRDESKGLAAANELGGPSERLVVTPLDVTDDASILEAATTVAARFAHLDALVNNAGISLDNAPPSTLPVSRMKAVYETNVFGPARVIQAFLPLLIRAPAGRIVNVSSGLGSLARQADPSNRQTARPSLGYGSSKTALNGVTIQFANELRGTSVSVNAVTPGFCATELNGFTGPRTAEQGAQIAIRLVCEEGFGTGGFYSDEGRFPW